MKISKSQLKQIINEETAKLLNENDVQTAASMAIRLLGATTRRAGQRENAIGIMYSIFKALGGDEALNTLKAATGAKEAEYKAGGESWIHPK
jgi:hypothetical protein